MRESFVALLIGGLPWRRLHTDPEALPFGPDTVFGRTLKAYQDAGASRIVLATGPRTADLETAIAPHGGKIEWVVADDAVTSIGPALAAGLRALGSVNETIAIGLADMPLLSGDLISKLAGEFRASGRPMGVPICQEQLGHPVFFLPGMRADLAKATGSGGYRDLLFARGDEVATLETPYTAVLRLVEGSPEYRELLQLAGLPVTAESSF
jgi:CTP:molybdopterin cytidylyltransferase MocA